MKQPGCSCRPWGCGDPCPGENAGACGVSCGIPCQGCVPCPSAPPCACYPPCPGTAACPCRPLCHPEDCRCDACRRRGCGGGRGYLLPRIIASGREWLRRCCMTLTVDGLPECAQPPFTLMAVCAAGEPSWTESPDPVRRMVCLHVTVPLLCQVRDGCGSVHTGRSCLEVDTALRLPVPQGECWRNALMVLPCVRLVCVPGGSSGACFDVQLEVLVESYMVRWEPCLPQSQRPACPPDLPLYPQPRLE